MKDCNYIAEDYNSYPTKTQTVFADPKDLTSSDDMWGNDASLKCGIAESAYCSRVYDLLRMIKQPRAGDGDPVKLKCELADLIIDDIDNYLFKLSESND